MVLLFDLIEKKKSKLIQIRLSFDSIESVLLSFDFVIPDGDKFDLVFKITAVSH